MAHQDRYSGTVCDICRKEFANSSNCSRHRALAHRPVQEVTSATQSSLVRSVSGLTTQLLRGDFTGPVSDLITYATTEEPSLSERDALIMVTAAAAAAKEVTHLQQNLESLRHNPGSTQTAEHRLARKLSYLSMGPNWDSVDRSSAQHFNTMLSLADACDSFGGLSALELLDEALGTAGSPTQMMDLAPPADMGSIFEPSPAATPSQQPATSVAHSAQPTTSLSSPERAAARDRLARAPGCRRTQASASCSRPPTSPGRTSSAAPTPEAGAKAESPGCRPTEDGRHDGRGVHSKQSVAPRQRDVTRAGSSRPPASRGPNSVGDRHSRTRDDEPGGDKPADGGRHHRTAVRGSTCGCRDRTSPHASGHSRDHRDRRRADAASTTSHRPRSRSRSGL